MITEKQWQILMSHPLFSRVSEEDVRAVLSDGVYTASRFSDGERIPTEDRLVLLLSGQAQIHTADGSRRVLLRILSVGDVFGMAGLFSEEAEVSSIYADGACLCLNLPESAVSALLEKSEAFRRNYIGFLTGRIRFLNQKIAYLTAGSAERRLALYLLSLGTGEITLKDSIGSLSELLNLGRASLYRAFDKLCEDGYLIKNVRQLTILNAEAMLNAYK